MRYTVERKFWGGEVVDEFRSWDGEVCSAGSSLTRVLIGTRVEFAISALEEQGYRIRVVDSIGFGHRVGSNTI